MSERALAIAGVGALTPVGLSAEATCAAVRAGISRMLALEGWDDGGTDPPEGLIAGRVPFEWLEGGPRTEWPGHERWNLRPPRPHLLVANGGRRLIDLALPAAEEAWRQASPGGGRAGLYLGLDEADRGGPIAEAIGAVLGVAFDPVREDRLGRAAGLAALHRAARHLREDRVDVALVGAVDSRIRRDVVEALAARGVVRTEDAPHGIIPGEAAAFLVLARDDPERRALGWLAGSGVSEEPTAGTDDPNQGVGLTRALRRARQAAPPLASQPFIVCDLNGERYRAMEWGLVRVRAVDDLRYLPAGPGAGDLWHPADCIGDPGAASGGLSVVCALTAMRKGYARADRALVWGASDGPLRAAAVLARERED